MSPPRARMEAPRQQEKSKRMQEGGTSTQPGTSSESAAGDPTTVWLGTPKTSVPHHWGCLRPVKATRCS